MVWLIRQMYFKNRSMFSFGFIYLLLLFFHRHLKRLDFSMNQRVNQQINIFQPWSQSIHLYLYINHLSINTGMCVCVCLCHHTKLHYTKLYYIRQQGLKQRVAEPILGSCEISFGQGCYLNLLGFFAELATFFQCSNSKLWEAKTLQRQNKIGKSISIQFYNVQYRRIMVYFFLCKILYCF